MFLMLRPHLCMWQMIDDDDDNYDPSFDETMWRCIDCDSRHHRSCETAQPKETA